MSFTAIFIAAFVGTLLTIFFAYFPKVRVFYAALALEKQALLKLGIMVVIAGAMFGLSFTSIFPPPLTLPDLFGVIIALIVTNKPVADLLPATRDVREAIRLRTAAFMRG